MSLSIRIEGLAIVSANGMIADSNCQMPNSLKLEADQEFFETCLDNAALLVHGRKSHEGQTNSANRRRLLLTRSVAALVKDEEAPNQWLWNPEGVGLDDVCRELAVLEGVVAILGGTAAYDMFLPRYSAFHLCRAGKVHIPDGTPVLSDVGLGYSPEKVMSCYGLAPRRTRMLDPEHDLTHIEFGK